MDHSISNFFIDHRPDWVGDLAKIVTLLGQFPVNLALILLAGILLRKRLELVAVAIVTGVFAYGLNSVLKKSIERSRPPKSHWFHGYEAHGYSLPSGHAINAGVLGLILFMWLPGEWKWTGVVVSVAVAWSRVQLGVHWPSDVIVGLGIGSGVAFIGQYSAPKIFKRAA